MTRDIEQWLSEFKDAWLARDVPAVLDLFTDDVIYYETPSERLDGKDAVRAAWTEIHEQEAVSLDLDIFSRTPPQYTVQWRLSYRKNEEGREIRGVYLIKLDADNTCYEFWQYCQTE